MSEADKARRRRNLAIGLALAAFIIVVFLSTILRIGGNIEQGTPF